MPAAGSKGKIAWCISPILSGVTTVYSVVGGGLRRAGWEVIAVNVGAEDLGKGDARFADDSFEILLPTSSDVRRNAAEFVRWVTERKIDMVFSQGQWFTIAAAPALPARTKLVTRSATITRYSYALASANLPRTDMIVVETPRQKSDLIRNWEVPPEKCAVIPGGVEVETFTPGTIRDFQGSLRIVYLGRLEESQKAVSMLPRIARRLMKSRVDFHLDIIGEGPEGDRLRAAFGQAKLAGHVTFHGYLPRQESLPILQRAHLSVLPSRYEGHSWALLETMASGCVPIVSRIAGGTDFVVEHGVNGILCPVGNPQVFTKEIVSLSAARKRLEILSAAASATIRERFSLDRVVRDHDTLFQALLAQEPTAYKPIPLSAIRAPDLSGPTWRRFVPQGVKNYVRNWAGRFHRSV